jgi:hypothetical protein
MAGEVVDGRFSIFETRPQQISVRETRTTQHQPTGVITNPDLEFIVTGTGEGWIDLSSSFFTISAGLVERDKQNKFHPVSPRALGVTCETNFADLLFSDVKMTLNGVDVSDENNGAAGIASFWKKCITKGGAYARGGSLTTAVLDAGQFPDATIGDVVDTSSNPSALARCGRIDVALGPGASEGCLAVSGPLNTDLPGEYDARAHIHAHAHAHAHAHTHAHTHTHTHTHTHVAKYRVDENYSDWSTAFRRGALHRGVTYESTTGSSAGIPEARQPRAVWEYRPPNSMWAQGKLLPPNTDIRLTLRKARDALVVHRDVPASRGSELAVANDPVNPEKISFLKNPGAFQPLVGYSADSYNEVLVDWAGQDVESYDAPDKSRPLKYKGGSKAARVTLHLVRIYPTESLKDAMSASLLRQPAYVCAANTRAYTHARTRARTRPSGSTTFCVRGCSL